MLSTPMNDMVSDMVHVMKADAASAEKPHNASIAVIDLGGQYCHLIGRRLRDLGINNQVVPHHIRGSDLSCFAGIILSGGPQSVYDSHSLSIDPGILALGRPILGICYGHQLLAKLLGAEVHFGSSEYGRSLLRIQHSCTLFEGIPDRQTVWMSHSDSVVRLVNGLVPIADTDSCEIAAFADLGRNFFGVQFHPEVVHTEYGAHVLKNFCRSICQISESEVLVSRVDRLQSEIRMRAGDNSVLFFVSGGVDSTVAFVLCAQALGDDRVFGIYVDTGLMRRGETEELRGILDRVGLAHRFDVRVERERFLNALNGVSDPEEKRAIIGRQFIEVQRDVIRELGVDSASWLLGQGTIYPDTIESGGESGAAATIKTHHNRCPEVRQMIAEGRVIEPLVEFYKDEVREIGAELGLPPELTERWPFPGPGLAIRCLGFNDPKENLMKPIELPFEFSDYQATQFPIRAVGVQGDGRTYRKVVAVTGPWDYEKLAEISETVSRAGRAHSRVIALVDARDEDPRFAMKTASLSRSRVELLRESDHIVRKQMESAGLMGAVWQFPVVLIPVSTRRGESIVLRPVQSSDGMTANFARLPIELLKRISDELLALPGVDAVFLDISDKPPATIEWE